MDKNINPRINKYSMLDYPTLIKDFDLKKEGLSNKDIENSKKRYGTNNIYDIKKDSLFSRLKNSFITPYSMVLLLLDIISLFTDIIFTTNKKYITCIIITTMLLISGIIRFIQETRSKKVTDNLINLVNLNVQVKRDGKFELVNFKDVVVGDLIKLKAGEIVPADIRIIRCNDLFVSQSLITGESKIEEKNNKTLLTKPLKISDYSNILFQGSNIIGGDVIGVILAVGNDTIYGKIPFKSTHKKDFDKGSNSIIWILIKFMMILIPIIFVASGLTKGNWLNAFLFAVSVAVGLTPELLPMVITACLAKGSYNMGQKKTIVKNVNAMQVFGNMDTLCVDKTGTLTDDALTLEYYMDILGNESQHVLDYAYLNSFYSNGINNQLDNSILHIKDMKDKQDYYLKLESKYLKIDEKPYDYNRKISSVLLKQTKNSNLLICKGSINEILKRCEKAKYKDKLIKITPDALKSVHAIVDEMLCDGMKVMAIASKNIQSHDINDDDEYGLTLIGYLCFFDAPKGTSYTALKKLKDLNINVKVLTGDDKHITLSICKRLNMDYKNIITGDELEKLNEDERILAIENSSIFCELTPNQKSKIISVLQANNHIVGFLGDGMNDLHAMLQADVGISVENASSSIKEIADVILLKKDLNVLEEGVIEGRKSFNNMSKYTKITASSNLGNILAIVIASIFLPFYPMTSIQLLLLNLLYDILCLVLPWDNVDKEMLQMPQEWTGHNLKKFMLTFGPISTIFDLVTFAFLFFYLCPTICGGQFNMLSEIEQTHFISIFQTGWFLESMWTQILIIHLLRTNKFPFVKSSPAGLVTLITIFGIILYTCLTISPIGKAIGMIELPLIYYLFLVSVVTLYLLLVTIIKRLYLKRNSNLI